MPSNKVILWDFDGTLVRRPFMWSEAVLAALDDALPDHAVTQDHVREHLQAGFPWHTPMVPHPELNEPQTWWAMVYDVFMPIFKALDCDGPTCRSLHEAIRSHIVDPRGYEVFDDVAPVLATLSDAGWRHVILSNHIPELPELIDQLEFGSTFECVLTSARTGYEKPHRRAFQIAKQTVGHAASIVMVGDNPVADVAGAASEGIPAVLVRTEDDSGRPRTSDLFGFEDLVTAGKFRAR